MQVTSFEIKKYSLFYLSVCKCYLLDNNTVYNVLPLMTEYVDPRTLILS